MEEIEYLEEYEDLILPQAFNSSNEFDNEGLSLDLLEQPTEHLEIFNTVTNETDVLDPFPVTATSDSNSRTLFQIISSEVIAKPLVITSGNSDSMTNESVSNKSSLQITPYEHEISNLSFLNRITPKTFPTNYTVQRLDKLKSVATVKPTLQRNIFPTKQSIGSTSPPLKKPYQLSPMIGSVALPETNIKNPSDREPNMDILVSKNDSHGLENDTFLDFGVDKNGCVDFDFETALDTGGISDICTESLNYHYNADNFNLETYIGSDSSLMKNKLKRENLQDSNLEVKRKKNKLTSSTKFPEQEHASGSTDQSFKVPSKHTKMIYKKNGEKKMKKKLDKSRLVFKKNGKKIIMADKSRFSFKHLKKQNDSVNDDKEITNPTQNETTVENIKSPTTQTIENENVSVAQVSCPPTSIPDSGVSSEEKEREIINPQLNNTIVNNTNVPSLEQTSTNNVPDDTIKVIFSSPKAIKSADQFDKSLHKDIAIEPDKCSSITNFGSFTLKSIKPPKVVSESFQKHISDEERINEQNFSVITSPCVSQLKVEDKKDQIKITKIISLEKKLVVPKEISFGNTFKIGAVDVKKVSSSAASSNATKKSEVTDIRSNEPVSNKSTNELQENLLNKSVEQNYSFLEKCNKEVQVVVEKENKELNDLEFSTTKIPLDTNGNNKNENENDSSSRTTQLADVSEVCVFSTEKPLDRSVVANDLTEKLTSSKTISFENEKIAFSTEKPADTTNSHNMNEQDEQENVSITPLKEKDDSIKSMTNKCLTKDVPSNDENETSTKNQTNEGGEISVCSTETPLDANANENMEESTLSIMPTRKSEAGSVVCSKKKKNDEKETSSKKQAKEGDISVCSTEKSLVDTNANNNMMENVTLSSLSTRISEEGSVCSKKNKIDEKQTKEGDISVSPIEESLNASKNIEEDTLSGIQTRKSEVLSRSSKKKRKKILSLQTGLKNDERGLRAQSKGIKVQNKNLSTAQSQIRPCSFDIKLNKHTVDKLIKSGEIRLHTPSPLVLTKVPSTPSPTIPVSSPQNAPQISPDSQKLAEPPVVIKKKRKKNRTRFCVIKRRLPKENDAFMNTISNKKSNLSGGNNSYAGGELTSRNSMVEATNKSIVEKPKPLSTKSTDVIVAQTTRRSSMKSLPDLAGNNNLIDRCSTNENESKRENNQKSTDQKTLKPHSVVRQMSVKRPGTPVRKLRRQKQELLSKTITRKGMRRADMIDENQQTNATPAFVPAIEGKSFQKREPTIITPSAAAVPSVLSPTVPTTENLTPALPTPTETAQPTLTQLTISQPIQGHPIPADPTQTDPTQSAAAEQTTLALPTPLIPTLPEPIPALTAPELPITTEARSEFPAPVVPTAEFYVPPTQSLSLSNTSSNCCSGISIMEPKREFNTDNVIQLCHTSISFSNKLAESMINYNANQGHLNFFRSGLGNQSCSNSFLTQQNDVNYSAFELPAYIVLKTKIITRQELNQNKQTNSTPSMVDNNQTVNNLPEQRPENVAIKTERPEFKEVCAQINELLGENANYLKFASALDRQSRMNGVLADRSLTVDDAQCTLKFLQSFLSTDPRDKIASSKGQQFIPIYDSRKNIIGYRKRTTRPSKSASKGSKESSKRLLTLRSFKSNAPPAPPAPAPVVKSKKPFVEKELIFSTKQEPDLDVADSEVIVPDDAASPEKEHCIKTEIGSPEEEAILYNK